MKDRFREKKGRRKLGQGWSGSRRGFVKGGARSEATCGRCWQALDPHSRRPQTWVRTPWPPHLLTATLGKLCNLWHRDALSWSPELERSPLKH